MWQVFRRWITQLPQWGALHVLGTVHLAGKANIDRNFYFIGGELRCNGCHVVQPLGSCCYCHHLDNDHSGGVWLYGSGWYKPQCCACGYTHSVCWSWCRVYSTYVYGMSSNINRRRHNTKAKECLVWQVKIEGPSDQTVFARVAITFLGRCSGDLKSSSILIHLGFAPVILNSSLTFQLLLRVVIWLIWAASGWHWSCNPCMLSRTEQNW